MHHGLRISLALAATAVSVALAQQPPHGMPSQGQPQAPPQIDLSLYQGPKGKLAVRAVQGTKSGPAVSGDEAELILFHRNAPIKRYPIQLDDQGVAIVSDLPLALELVPMVRVKHAGVFYQQVGDPLDASRPNSSMEVTVFEVTDSSPAWKVVLRQVMFARKASGADVAETVIVENPGDQTWLGGAADEQGRRATVSLTLPPGASDVELEQGFHGWCCTAFKGSQLDIQMPLMPGKMTYQFAYSIPIKDGQFDLRFVAPTIVQHIAISVPERDYAVQATVLAPGDTDQFEGQTCRIYQAESVKPGETVGVVLTPVASSGPSAAKASDSKGFGFGVGVGVLVLGAIGGVFIKRAFRR